MREEKKERKKKNPTPVWFNTVQGWWSLGTGKRRKQKVRKQERAQHS